MILTALDIQSGLGAATVVPTKDFNPYAVSEIRRFVYESGRTYGVIQSDQEKSIRAIADAVVRQVGGMKVRQSPKYSSQSQGSVERFHQSLFAQARVLKFQVQKKYNVTIDSTHPLVTWIVRHSAWLLNRYQVHSDGFTSYQRRWGKTFQQPLCEFAETVMFKPSQPPQQGAKFEPRWFKAFGLDGIQIPGRFFSGHQQESSRQGVSGDFQKINATTRRRSTSSVPHRGTTRKTASSIPDSFFPRFLVQKVPQGSPEEVEPPPGLSQSSGDSEGKGQIVLSTVPRISNHHYHPSKG